MHKSRFLITLIALLLPCVGHADVLMDRLIQAGDTAGAHRLMERWMRSNDPTMVANAEYYLLFDGNSLYRPLPDRDAIAAKLVDGRWNRIYPAVVLYWKTHGTPHQLNPQVKIAADQMVADAIAASGRPAVPSWTKTTAPEASKAGEVTRLKINTLADFEMADAMRAAGGLQAISEIAYRGSVQKLSAPGNFADGPVELKKYLDWVFANKLASQYSAVMALRDQLSGKSDPTREQLGNRILDVVNGADAESAEDWRMVVREKLVQKRDDRYYSTEKQKVQRQSLGIDLKDPSDLALANALNAHGLLSDVEMVTFFAPTKEAKRKEDPFRSTVNFPEHVWIENRDGLRIGEVISPSNFRPIKDRALNRSTASTKLTGEIARDDKLLDLSTSKSPSDLQPPTASPCNFKPLAARIKERTEAAK